MNNINENKINKEYPKISIIVPIYRAEKELPRCIESIINQTYKNLEIILINDGSPDRCGDICERYSIQDNRIIVINKLNGGVSSARNAGLDIATGEYIGFIDADDWVEPEYVEFLYKLAAKSSADISICGHYVHLAEDNIIERNKVINEMLTPDEAIYYAIRGTYFDGYVWNKLFARHLFFQNNIRIRFDEKLHICEDLYLVCCCIATANNIVYSPKPFYHYMIRPDSATNLYSEKVITKLEAYSNIIQLLEQVSCDKNVDLAKMRYTQFAIDIRRMALEANDKVMIKHIKSKNTNI